MTESDIGEEEEEQETEEVDEEDGLDGDTVWDPDHATPWRPRRSRRNTSQLTARQPFRMLLDKVGILQQQLALACVTTSCLWHISKPQETY